jgi:hypothetical protein
MPESLFNSGLFGGGLGAYANPLANLNYVSGTGGGGSAYTGPTGSSLGQAGSAGPTAGSRVTSGTSSYWGNLNTTKPSTSTGDSGGGYSLGLRLPGYTPPAPKPTAPAGPSAAEMQMLRYQPRGGGGGGSSFSFNFGAPSMPSLIPSAGMDLGGIFDSFSNLLDKSQQSDVEQLAPAQQANSMAIQALKEAGQGWQGSMGSMSGVNPNLGVRIPPDESRKLAQVQGGRVY